jgi:hypothetical protein
VRRAHPTRHGMSRDGRRYGRYVFSILGGTHMCGRGNTHLYLAKLAETAEFVSALAVHE